jgi:hypothetical protein
LFPEGANSSVQVSPWQDGSAGRRIEDFLCP